MIRGSMSKEIHYENGLIIIEVSSTNDYMCRVQTRVVILFQGKNTIIRRFLDFMSDLNITVGELVKNENLEKEIEACEQWGRETIDNLMEQDRISVITTLTNLGFK